PAGRRRCPPGPADPVRRRALGRASGGCGPRCPRGYPGGAPPRAAGEPGPTGRPTRGGSHRPVPAVAAHAGPRGRCRRRGPPGPARRPLSGRRTATRAGPARRPTVRSGTAVASWGSPRLVERRPVQRVLGQSLGEVQTFEDELHG